MCKDLPNNIGAIQAIMAQLDGLYFKPSAVLILKPKRVPRKVKKQWKRNGFDSSNLLAV